MSGIVVLTGGVGGAKLVLGLIHAVDPASVTAIVNTGDDFHHLGQALESWLFHASRARGRLRWLHGQVVNFRVTQLPHF